MHPRPVLLKAASAALIPLAGAASAFAQCAMCKTVLTSSAEGQRMAGGFNTGIVFLLAVPFVVVGTLGLLVLNARRRHGE